MSRPRRVALAAIEPTISGGDYTPFSFGIRRVMATVMSDPELAEMQPTLVESRATDVEGWVDQIEATDADVIGFAAYVWSFPTFLEVATRLKRSRPEKMIVFGGPSARPAMMSLAPFAERAANVDALVMHDGEAPFRDLLRALSPARVHSPSGQKSHPLGLSASALRNIPGLALRGLAGFAPTPKPASVALDDLASPVRLGLIPKGRTVALETYRGCPLSCSFCQWGEMDTPTSVFSTEYLTRELEGLAALDAPSVQLVDAALNLSSRAFRNLAEAERSVGLFRRAKLFSCLYPSHLNDSHLEFLSSIKRPRIDVGLQSFSKSALDAVDRPFSEVRFRQVMTELSRIAEVEVEVILGLPGDSPETFRETVLRALELPCRVRVFHCLVLPDALLTRSHPDDAVVFDPLTLRLTSCRGFSPAQIQKERDWLDGLAQEFSGEATSDMWSFPPPHQRGARPFGSTSNDPSEVWIAGRAARSISSENTAEMGRVISATTKGMWHLVRALTLGDEVLATIRTPDNVFVLEMKHAEGAGRAYRVVDGIAFSYRPEESEGGGFVGTVRFSRDAIALLERVLIGVRATASRALSPLGASL